MANEHFWKIIVPTATTNLATNPSFETDTTGWTTIGTNTITRTDEQWRRGFYSLKCTYGNSGALALQLVTLTATNTAAGIDIYIPSGYTGTQISFEFASFVGMTGTTSVDADMTITDDWQRIDMVALPDAGGLNGALRVGVTGTPTGEYIYIDGIQLETQDAATTYTDNTRSALDQNGGILSDLADDLNFIVATQDGTGMPPVTNLSSPLALQPGAIFEDQTIDTRQFTLTGSVVGDSVNDFHNKKQALIAALNPSTVKISQRAKARIFRYTGSTVEKEIYAVYDGGLEEGLPNGFANTNVPLRLKADDPMFYAVYEDREYLSISDTIASSQFRKRTGVKWAEATTALGNVFALEAVGNYIYIGGTSGQRIYKYDAETDEESSLGTGLNNTVYTITSDGQNGVYVGGDFTTAGGASANYIAHWNGTTWAALGTGLNAHCEDIAVDSNGNVYATGDFTTAGGVSVNYVAMWNGSTWAALGTGVGSNGQSIAIDSNDNVYVGGDFTTAGGVSVSKIAMWNGAAWESTGASLNGTVHTIVVDDNNIVYIGGSFTGTVKKYQNGVWSNVGSEISGNCLDLLINAGKLYATGTVAVNGITGVIVFNGQSWDGVGISSTSSDAFKKTGITSNGSIFTGGGSGTMTIAGETSISYSGTSAAYMKIIISRDGGTSALVSEMLNITTGARISMSYALVDGETITINTKPGEQSAISSIGGDIYSYISPGSDFGNFFLMPGNKLPFTNAVGCLVIESGSPTVSVRIEYKKTFISED